MTDITTCYVCEHYLEPVGQAGKEITLKCKKCNIKITASIISVEI